MHACMHCHAVLHACTIHMQKCLSVLHHSYPAVATMWLVLSGFTEGSPGLRAKIPGSGAGSGVAAKRARPQHGPARQAPAEQAAAASWETEVCPPATDSAADASASMHAFNLPSVDQLRVWDGVDDLELPRLPTFASADLLSHFDSGLGICNVSGGDISVASESASLMHAPAGMSAVLERTSDPSAQNRGAPREVRGGVCHVSPHAGHEPASCQCAGPTHNDDAHACAAAWTCASVRCGVNQMCCSRMAARNLVREVHARYSGMLPRAALETLFWASRGQAASTLETFLTQGSLDTSADTGLSRDRDGGSGGLSMDSSCDRFRQGGSAEGRSNTSGSGLGAHTPNTSAGPRSAECQGKPSGGAGPGEGGPAAAEDFHASLVVVVGAMLQNLCLAIEEVMSDTAAALDGAEDCSWVGESRPALQGSDLRRHFHAQVRRNSVAAAAQRLEL